MSALNALHPSVLAAFWMTGTLVSFMALAIGGRQLSSELGVFNILFFRSLAGVVITSALLMGKNRRQIITSVFGKHLLRNLAHFGGQYGWFYGIAFIPLAEVFAIEFTVPVWTAVLATLILKEKMTRHRLVAIGLGIAGMLIILRPGMDVVNPAALAVLGGAVCYAVSHTFTKTLARTDSALCIVFYMTAIQLPMGLIPALWNWKTPSVEAWPWIFIVGVSALTAHFCMARALALADATIVVCMDFLRLPLIALVGIAVYNEPMDWLVMAGAVIMLAGNTIGLAGERR